MSASGSIFFLDTFSNDQLSSVYHRFDEGITDTYGQTSGWLKIAAGLRQDLWTGKTGAPLLLHAAPQGCYWLAAGNYSVETFVSADPITQSDQPTNTQIGLFVFKDVDNWLFFGLTNHNFVLDDGPHLGNGLIVTKTEGGSSSAMPIIGAYADPLFPTHDLPQDDSLYLRISKQRNEWNFYWKLHHNDAWNLLATVNFALGVHKVGMGVKTFDVDGATLEPGEAYFDYFLIRRDPSRTLIDILLGLLRPRRVRP